MTDSSCAAQQSTPLRRKALARNPLQISKRKINESLSNQVRSRAWLFKVTNATLCSKVPEMLFDSKEEPAVVFQLIRPALISWARSGRMVTQLTVCGEQLQEAVL